MLKPRSSSMGTAATRAWGVVMLCILVIGLTYMSEEAKLAQAKEEVIEATNKRAHVESSCVEKFKKMQREVQELNEKMKGSKEDCKASIEAEKQKNEKLSEELNQKFTRQESSQAELDRLVTSEHTLETALKTLQEKYDLLLQQKADLEVEVTKVTATQEELTAALQTCTARVKTHEGTAQEIKAVKTEPVAKLTIGTEVKKDGSLQSSSVIATKVEGGSDKDEKEKGSHAQAKEDSANNAKGSKESGASDGDGGSEDSQGGSDTKNSERANKEGAKEVKDEDKGKEGSHAESSDSNESDA